MENKNMTAVEWFAAVTASMGYVSQSILEEAKKMQYNELFKFWNGGIAATEEGGKDFEQFYNQYFQKQNHD